MEQRSDITDVTTKKLYEKEKAASERKNLLKAVSIVYSSIVGAGIFVTISDTFNVFSSNPIGMVLVFWLIGGVIAICGAACYVELSTRFPGTGGDSLYLKKGFNNEVSAAVTIIYVYVVKTVLLAALGLTTSKFLIGILPIPQQYTEIVKKLTAVVFIVVCCIINCNGNKIVVNISPIIMSVKMLLVGIIFVIGCINVRTNNIVWQETFDLKGLDSWGLSMAFISICWSFEGWNGLSMIAGKIKDPEKILPKGIGIGVIGVIFTYLAMVMSYYFVLGYDSVRYAEAVAITFGQRTLGKAYPIIPILICCSVLGSTLGSMYSCANVALSAAYRKKIPRIFSLVHKKSRSPVVSLISMTILALLFIPFKFQVLLQYCSFLTWLIYALSFVSLTIFKIQQKFSRKVMKEQITQVNILIPLFMLIVCAFMIVANFMLSFYGCTSMLILSSLVFAYQYVPTKKTDPKASSIGDKIFTFCQHPFFGLEVANEYDI